MGYSVEAPVSLPGRSGVLHDFDLCAQRGKERVVIEVEGLERPAVISLIALRAKALDADLDHLLLVTGAPITEEARRVASSYRIRIVPSMISTSDLRRELADFLSSDPTVLPLGKALAT